MRTLYVSDLDGTLLQNDATLSPFARKSIVKLLEAGVNFTIATARSVKSVQRIFDGIQLEPPIIELDGAFISDLDSGNHIETNSIDHTTYNYITSYLSQRGVSYFVSSFDGERDNLYYERAKNEGEQWYVNDLTASSDPRLRKTKEIHSIRWEEIIRLTVIDTYDQLAADFEFLQDCDDIETHFQENPYSPGWYWLTVHSSGATKAKAIKALTELSGLGSQPITVFGDNTNDIKMMKIADAAVAVSNAKPEVLAVADEVIQSNEEDGVIRYILKETGL